MTPIMATAPTTNLRILIMFASTTADSFDWVLARWKKEIPEPKE
jgi:hypothetical protein